MMFGHVGLESRMLAGMLTYSKPEGLSWSAGLPLDLKQIWSRMAI
jgi:hypothetical protein